MKKLAIVLCDDPNSAFLVLYALSDRLAHKRSWYKYQWRLRDKNTGAIEVLSGENDECIYISTKRAGVGDWEGKFLHCLVDDDWETEEVPLFGDFVQIRNSIKFDKISRWNRKGFIVDEKDFC